MLSPPKKPFYKKTALRFHCTECGKCCYGDPKTHYIAVNDKEIEQIRIDLGLSRTWFLRRYTETLPSGDRGILLTKNGACPFLINNRCSIYKLRPVQCRSYPFWPEVIGSRSGWLSETKRCEGIGQGAVVPVSQIEKRLLAAEG